MKAPSSICLRALRRLALSDSPAFCTTICRRTYASIPDSNPPTTKARNPPPPPSAIKGPPQDPGWKLRGKKDDDEDHIPIPLSRPIGMPNAPQPGENTGLDNRSLQQRRDDFVNYDKHLARRSKMTKQIAKPYFRDWSNMRFSKGKQFVSNDRLFRAEHALFFPNFFGKILRADAIPGPPSDGYKGLGRNTCDVMRGKVSVVSIVSSTWALNQTNTFCSPEANPELHAILAQEKDIAQVVEINREEQQLKWWLLQAFRSNLRKQRSPEHQDRYFMVKRGISEIMKEAIGLLNDKVGYVYLVDHECRIRWAGSAIAEPQEKESMVRGLRRLVQEARMPQDEKSGTQKLEDAVAEVVHEAVTPLPNPAQTHGQ